MYLLPSELSDSELRSLGIESSNGFSTFTVENTISNPFDIDYEDAMIECFRGVHSTARTPGATQINEWQTKILSRVGIDTHTGIFTGGLIHLRLKRQLMLDLVKFKLSIDAAAEELSISQHQHLQDLTRQIGMLNTILVQGIAGNSVTAMSKALDERDHLLCQVASMVITPDFVDHLKDPVAFNEIFGRTIGKYVLGYIQENPQVYCDPKYTNYTRSLSFDNLVHYQEPQSQSPSINLESIQEFTHRRYL